VPRRHVALAVLVAVAWGLNFVVIDVGLESFPPLLFAALRFTLVALPAVFLVGSPRTSWRTVVGVGLFTSTGQFALLFVGLDRGLPAGLASLVLQVQTVFTILLAMAVLGERLTRARAAGVALAVVGIAIIALGRDGDVPLLALALCIGAAASWGVGNVIMRAAQPPEPLALIVWSSLVPPLPLAGLSLAFEGGGSWGDAFSGLGVAGLLALAYVVVIATFFGYGTWTWLMARHPASTVAPFTLLVPVVGIATAWLVRDESPGPAELAGAVVVLAAVALATGLVGSGRREAAPAPPLPPG
jgi:O-acetylserine/cysteine efflux transporter